MAHNNENKIMHSKQSSSSSSYQNENSIKRNNQSFSSVSSDTSDSSISSNRSVDTQPKKPQRQKSNEGVLFDKIIISDKNDDAVTFDCNNLDNMIIKNNNSRTCQNDHDKNLRSSWNEVIIQSTSPQQRQRSSRRQMNQNDTNIDTSKKMLHDNSYYNYGNSPNPLPKQNVIKSSSSSLSSPYQSSLPTDPIFFGSGSRRETMKTIGGGNNKSRYIPLVPLHNNMNNNRKRRIRINRIIFERIIKIIMTIILIIFVWIFWWRHNDINNSNIMLMIRNNNNNNNNNREQQPMKQIHNFRNNMLNTKYNNMRGTNMINSSSTTNMNWNETILNSNYHNSPKHIPDYLRIHAFVFDPITNIVTTITNHTSIRSNIIDTCIVSTYFRLKSKYDVNEYIQNWIPNILSLRDECMMIFCEYNMIDILYIQRIKQLLSLSSVRNSNINNVDNTTMKPIVTFFIEIKLNDLPIRHYYYNSSDIKNRRNMKKLLISSLQQFPSFNDEASSSSVYNNNDETIDIDADQFWSKQFNLDIEKKRHIQYKLFWIWLSKSWFVVICGNIISNFNHNNHLLKNINNNHHEDIEEVDQNNNLMLLWSDIGCYRNTKYNDQVLIQHRDIVPKQSILWVAHRTPNPPPNTLYWNDKLNPKQKQFFYHSGSSGVGYYHIWELFHKNFINTLNEFVSRDMFIGEDQCILQSTCLVYNTICSYVDSQYVPDNHYFSLRYLLRYGNETSSILDGNYYKTDSRYLPSFWVPPKQQLTHISATNVNITSIGA